MRIHLSSIVLNLFLIVYSALILCGDILAAEPVVPGAEIILFTPKDVTAPPAKVYLERLHDCGVYAETFFEKELKQWGYKPGRRELFERDAKGKMKVTHVKGRLNAAGGEYTKKWISKQVLDSLKNDHGKVTAGNLYWIFVYIGDPPKRHSNYRGLGNSRDGGWAVLNYTNLLGKVSASEELISDFHDQIFLKGSIHEFGHALGLPHIGPKVNLGRGNTLMGPVTRIYRNKKMPDQNKAYLSEASAAILSAHPAFTGNPGKRNLLPKPGFSDLKQVYELSSKSIALTGKVESVSGVHRVVVIDDREDKPGAYWVKGYVAEVEADGSFSIFVPRPQKCRGALKLLVVYKNGAVTGDGIRRGIGSAKLIPYSYSP